MAGWREVALAAAAAWLPACALMAADSLPADRAENAQPAASRTGFVQPGAGNTVTLAALEDALRDDALRFWPGLQRPQLQVSAEALTWPDGSLGCPQPGRAYTQALVAGWRLVVRGPGHQAVYHASQRGAWLLCPAGAMSATPPARPGEVSR